MSLINYLVDRFKRDDEDKPKTQIFDSESFKKAKKYVEPITTGIRSGVESVVDEYTTPREKTLTDSLVETAMMGSPLKGAYRTGKALFKDEDFMKGLSRAGTIISPAETALTGAITKSDKPIKERVREAFQTDASLIDAFQSRNVPGAVPLGLAAGMLLPDAGDIKNVTKAAKGAKAFIKSAKPANLGSDLAKQSYKFLEDNVDNLVKEYKSKFGNVVNPDNAKDLFKNIGYNGRNAADFHEASSALSKQVYREILEEAKDLPQESKRVLFTAGGSGSGKSTAIGKLIDADDYPAVFDGTFANFSSSKKKIQQAIDEGFRPEIAYVYRNPVTAWTEGVLRRTAAGKRHVPMDVHIDMHDDALKSIQKLSKEFGDKVDVSIIDNSGKLEDIKEVDLNFLENLSYNKDDVKRQILQQTEELTQSGFISKEKLPEIYDVQKDPIRAEVRTRPEGRDYGVATAARTDPTRSIGLEEPPLVQNALDRTQLTGKQLDTPTEQLLKNVDNGDAGVVPLVKETPASPPKASVPQTDTPGKVPEGMKERKFVETVREADTTAEPVAKAVKGVYKPIGNKKTLQEAQKFIDTNGVDAAMRLAKDADAPSAQRTAVQMDLMRRFQNEGNYEMAIDVAETAAEQATNLGQTIQALSIWSRITPEGALRAMQRNIKKANKGRGPKNAIKLSEEGAEEITKQAKKVQKLRERVDVEGGDDLAKKLTQETAKLQDTMSKQIPASLWSKIGTFQTFAQLLNPKTAIRNILGNLGFSAIENIKDLVAVPVDALTSLATKKKTKAWPSIGTQLKAGKEGAILGFEEVIKGIDTSATSTKFDLKNTDAFRGKVGQAFKKMLDMELKVPDRAFANAAYEESLRQQMKAAGVKNPTQDMIDNAKYDSLYKTFQDDTVLSKMFSRLKKALNVGQEFGLGDFVLKYPKTPANLLARSIDYSPAGLVQAAFELFRPWRTGEFKQKQFVESVSRSLTGTAALVGSGAILHRMGILTGEAHEDPDVRSVQREVGLGAYRINVSALGRWIMSGFDPEIAKPKNGDLISSFDWFQPQSVNLAIGADIDKNGGLEASVLGKIGAAMTSSANTLTEQPLLTGLNRLFAYGDLPGGVQKVLEGMPASFTPTFLKQIAQLMDNTARNPQDPDPLVKGLNMAKKKLPGLSKTMTPYVTTRGEPSELYQNNTNHIFNVMFNPAFTARLDVDPVSKEVLDLYTSTGETKQLPRTVSKKVQVNGEYVELSAEQQAKMQTYIGGTTQILFENLVNNPKFQELDDVDKVNEMAKVLTYVNVAAKIHLLGHSPKNVGKDTMRALNFMNEVSQGRASFQKPQNNTP